MQQGNFLAVRLVFIALFLGSLLIGYLLCHNYDRYFGAHPDLPSENASARTYTKVQVFAVWAHVVFLTGTFAFLMH